MTEKKDTQEFLYSASRGLQKQKSEPYKLKLRNWLNGIFMVLAIATIVIYFLCPAPQRTLAVFAVGCAAVIVKTAEVTIRMTRKHTRK
jgi:hypothetical protein